MRFIDSNVFVYAYYKPRRLIDKKAQEMKNEAKDIVRRVAEGEDVVTSIVHIAEMVNILKYGMNPDELSEFVMGLFMLKNFKVVDVTKEDYISALDVGKDLKIDPNDALAVLIMEMMDVSEIYSFDTDFDKVNVTRLPYI